MSGAILCSTCIDVKPFFELSAHVLCCYAVMCGLDGTSCFAGVAHKGLCSAIRPSHVSNKGKGQFSCFTCISHAQQSSGVLIQVCCHHATLLVHCIARSALHARAAQDIFFKLQDVSRLLVTMPTSIFCIIAKQIAMSTVCKAVHPAAIHVRACCICVLMPNSGGRSQVSLGALCHIVPVLCRQSLC